MLYLCIGKTIQNTLFADKIKQKNLINQTKVKHFSEKMKHFNFFTIALAVLSVVCMTSLLVSSENLSTMILSKAIAAAAGYIIYVKYGQWKKAGYLDNIEKLAQE